MFHAYLNLIEDVGLSEATHINTICLTFIVAIVGIVSIVAAIKKRKK